jgi:hypothetical protein
VCYTEGMKEHFDEVDSIPEYVLVAGENGPVRHCAWRFNIGAVPDSALVRLAVLVYGQDADRMARVRSLLADFNLLDAELYKVAQLGR